MDPREQRDDARSGVSFCEVALRDGLQSWPGFIPTADKIRLLRAIAGTGVDEVDVTSFVPSSTVPQFADAEEVLAAVPDGPRVRVLTVNVKGVARVIEASRTVRRIDVCGMPLSASEAHNKANLRRTKQDQMAAMENMVGALLDAGIAPLIGVVTAFGCPIQGAVPVDDVFEIVGWAHSLGVRSIMFGDTTGMGNPRQVGDLFRSARVEWPDAYLVGHFHDNRGAGIANSLAALDAGADMVDGSLGGIGGEPQVVDQGFVGTAGNTASEDLLSVLTAMGHLPGVDTAAMMEAGALLQAVTGEPLFSRVQLADGAGASAAHV